MSTLRKAALVAALGTAGCGLQDTINKAIGDAQNGLVKQFTGGVSPEDCKAPETDEQKAECKKVLEKACEAEVPGACNALETAEKAPAPDLKL